jgi:hypothetical protein
MKKIISLTIFAFLTFYSVSQIERIESIQLDSLIWVKINEYRISKGAPAFKIFEDSLMRRFCSRVAYRNIDKEIPRHSDSVGYWSNAECLYRYAVTGSISKIHLNGLNNEDIEFFAEKTVQAWINSPTHEKAISRPEYNIATIVSIIIIDRKKESLRFDATFHALDEDHNTFNGYVYRNSKKKSQ